ncbi:MAG TPA: hypothetical protein PKC97_06225 [Burkholderiaceae bacterium]|nr:hypothetical protein [Burkholderiaceae bacterium]
MWSAAPYAWWLLPAWVLGNALLLTVYRRDLLRLWREPVFRHPVLIIESDDWGAGPLSQASALRDIANVLARHRDAAGRAPVLNLALVLAVPDGPAIQAGAGYHRVCLDAPVFSAVMAALKDGQASGVFALQLHGLEHYWPAALMASNDADVHAWLRQPVPATTEHLPSPLQSRWIDAASLPSNPHTSAAICAAVAEEVQAYTRVFGAPPKVVVPPTFVWTREVESAWAAQGIECIVTPGWRYTGRNAHGMPDGDEGPIVNGDRSGNVTYLARTDYFEPRRGRDAAYALRALARAVVEGRVCLLENHRDNFIAEPEQHRQSLAELDKLYREALTRHADLRFLSSSELGTVLRTRDPQWLVLATRERLPFIWQRLHRAGRLWKLMSLTGLAALGAMIVWAFGAGSAERARRHRS